MASDPDAARVRRRHDDIPQDALFDLPPAESLGGGETRKARAPRSVRYGPCSNCATALVGYIKEKGALIYREHTVRTHGGVTFRCSASGQPVASPPSA